MKNRLAAMLRTRDVWPAVEAELQRLGVAYRLTIRGKHPVVVIDVDGRTRRIPFPNSPKSHGHMSRKVVCQVRRAVATLRTPA
ncbi:hypothetical protein ACFQ4O_02080 [Methylopila musalis]|uniref:Type II toxin-antitoxin system HicA family toxin n=1 Tax=Methylopila musalis TaxID=1134781 RepID=A0ABW3Z3E2_9HYPH